MSETLAPLSDCTTESMCREYVALVKVNRELNSLAEENANRMKRIEAELVDRFADSGIKRLNVDGMTLYTRVDRFVNKKADVPTPQMVDALRKAGLADLCNESYSAASLKSRVLEWIDAGEAVPEPLAECINITESPRLVATVG